MIVTPTTRQLPKKIKSNQESLLSVSLQGLDVFLSAVVRAHGDVVRVIARVITAVINKAICIIVFITSMSCGCRPRGPRYRQTGGETHLVLL